jgi:hypothetical protein
MTDTSRKGKLKTAAARWRSRRRAARPAPRWRAWVEALLARYLRRPARPGSPGRVLARPPRPLSLVRERWLLAARTLLPQIHLAVQPLLRVWQTRPVVTPHHRGAGRRAELASLPGAGFTPALALLARRARLREPVPAGPAPSGVAPRAGAAPPPARPPLQLVYQRLREPERVLGAVAAARREAGWAARPELVRRLAERSRRREQAPAAAPARMPDRVMARRLPAAAPAPASPSPPAAPWDSRDSKQWRAMQARFSGPASGLPAAPPPVVNVAALADQVMQQIDGRLNAWRERTGH